MLSLSDGAGKLAFTTIAATTLGDLGITATASELNLNDEQFERLKSYYIDRYIDNMSMKDLMEYVANDMDLHLEKLSDIEVISDISFYFEDHFNDIVSEVREGII